MAYPYYPMGYQYPQNSIIWVQGIEGAKSHPVGAGQSVLLMDSESNCFFIKSADASGMPQPLRVFDYTERAVRARESASEAPVDMSVYVTRKELEARLRAVYGETDAYKEGNKDAE